MPLKAEKSFFLQKKVQVKRLKSIIADKTFLSTILEACMTDMEQFIKPKL